MFRIASGRRSQDSCDSVPGGYEATRPINLSYQRHKTRSNSLGCVVSGHGDTCARGITMITWVRMSNICTNCVVDLLDWSQFRFNIFRSNHKFPLALKYSYSAVPDAGPF